MRLGKSGEGWPWAWIAAFVLAALAFIIIVIGGPGQLVSGLKSVLGMI